VVAFIIWVATADSGPGELDDFAGCLKDKGVIFYGAFWCPHCAAQKARFGKSAELLPYVECSTPDSRGQLQICKDKNITSYPTWDFPASADPTGLATTTTRLTSEVELVTLAEKTGCILPERK